MTQPPSPRRAYRGTVKAQAEAAFQTDLSAMQWAGWRVGRKRWDTTQPVPTLVVDYVPNSSSLQLRLGLRQPPRNQNSCKVAKKYARQQSRQQGFANPFTDGRLKRIAGLLAAEGLVSSGVGEGGDPTLLLTESGIARARSMSSIPDEATPEEVVAALLAPLPEPSPEPSPSPLSVELVLPEPEESSTP